MKYLFCLLLPLALAAPVGAEDDARVPFPEGWRDWFHVKSMIIEPGHPLYAAFGGIHHIYANELAVEGYRQGQFPDGAVIVFDLFEAERAEQAVTEGDRKVAGVMHKYAAAFSETGGWGFEAFAGGDPERRLVGNQAATACYACHAPEQDFDYVFSRIRD